MGTWTPPGWEPGYVRTLVTSVIDCCGNFEVTEDDEREIEFWGIIYEDVNTIFDILSADEIFGKKEFCVAQNLMDAHHLLMFLQLIQKEREFDASTSSTGLDKGSTYYIQEYCTKNIRDKYYCKGYSIQKILKIFELFELAYEGDGPGGSTSEQDGIGYMQIEGDSDPIFRVT